MIRKLVRQMLTAQVLSALTVSLCLLIDSIMIGRFLGNDAMAAYGYALAGFLSEDAGGVPAEGYRYTYTTEDVGMTGESFSLKKGKTFYYLHAYYRTELAEESASVIREMLSSSEWV